MNQVYQAGLWGGVSGAALVVGAGVGYWANVPRRVVAGVMAFGAGVLLSAIAFELMDHAYQQAGLVPTALGFLVGAAVYTLANRMLASWGAKHRKRSRMPTTEPTDTQGTGVAIAVGALLDGIPESIVLGLSVLHGGAVSMATLVAIFLSNLPEGLSSSAGLRRAGRAATYIFGMWISIALATAVASVVGYTVFGSFSAPTVAATTTVAAGAMLAMVADTMMPEAFAETHDFAGLITVAGFLVSFALSKLAG